MKKITLLFLMTILTSVVMAQTTFNWVSETISPENNLRQMHLYEDNTAVIVGLNNVLTKYDPATTAWNSVNIAKPSFDFIDLSIKNGFGILSSRRSMMINNPSNDDLYANGRFLKTTDNGATWTNFDLSPMAAIEIDSLNPIDKGSLAMDIFANEYIDENNILLYSGWYDYRTESKVSRGAVFATTDGGVSWAPVTEDLKSAVITSIYNNGTYNVIAGLNLLRKHNTGESVSTDIYPALVTANGGVDASIYIFDITIVDANTFYVASSTDGIFLTTDAGASFTKLASGAPAGANDFYVHNSNIMMSLGTSAKSLATKDGGITWTNCYPGASCWEISGVFNGYLYALAKSAVYKMTVADFEAGTYNWTTATVKEGSTLQKMHIIDDVNAFIIGSDETVVMSTDGGLTWVDIACPDPVLPIADEIDFCTFDASGTLSLAGATRMKLIDYPTTSEYADFYIDGLIFQSTDNFETYSILDITKIGELASEDSSLNTSLDVCYGSSPIAIAILNETTILAAITWYETIIDGKATHTRIFKSVDAGDTWKSVSDDLGSSFITGMNFLNENYGFITGNKVLLKTTDGGETFTDLYPILDVDSDDNMFIYEVNIINDNELYVSTGLDGVYKSLDGGTTFTKFAGLSGCSGFIKLNSSTFMTLGSTSSKCYYSNDLGTTWESCYPGSAVYNIGSIMNGYLYALGKGVVYKISVEEIASTTTGLNTLPKLNAISVRYLSEGIELVSSESQIDQCILYSITGKVMGSYNPKSVSFKIYTADLPSGIYIAATITNGKHFTNKLYVK